MNMSTLLLLLFVTSVNSYKILMFVPSVSKSNVIFFNRISDLLVNAGHQVTLYRPHYTDTVLNVKSQLATEVRVPGPDREAWRRMEKMEDWQAWNDYNIFQKNQRKFISTFLELMESSCENQASNFEVLEKLRKENFDLAVANMYELCPFGLIHVLGIKSYLYLSSSIMNELVAGVHGLPNPPSWVPGIFTGYGDYMNYWERMQNFLGSAIMSFMAPGMIDGQEKAFKKHYGNDFPSFESLMKKAQLLLINSEELIDLPRPILHKTIYIGGIGMQDPKPLTKEWETMMRNSQDGVILMSFGSVVNASDMPIEWKKSFFKSFSKFPTYTFIFKYEYNDLAQLPEAKDLKNVHVVPWLPQTDILGHSKTKLFITHGGYNGILETANAGVPVLCMPLFGDQFRNCKAAERHGFGVSVPKTLASDANVFTKGIQTVLENTKYNQKAKEISKMIHKKPVKSEELVVKWIEFLAEFKEIPNLQAAGADMSFIEYYCIDVLLGLFTIISLVLFIGFTIFASLVRVIFRRRKTKTD